MRSPNRAFTLLELLIVLLIIGILIAIGLYRYQSVVEAANDKKAESQVRAAFINAGAYKVKNGDYDASPQTLATALDDPDGIQAVDFDGVTVPAFGTVGMLVSGANSEQLLVVSRSKDDKVYCMEDDGNKIIHGTWDGTDCVASGSTGGGNELLVGDDKECSDTTISADDGISITRICSVVETPFTIRFYGTGLDNTDLRLDVSNASGYRQNDAIFHPNSAYSPSGNFNPATINSWTDEMIEVEGLAFGAIDGMSKLRPMTYSGGYYPGFADTPFATFTPVVATTPLEGQKTGPAEITSITNNTPGEFVMNGTNLDGIAFVRLNYIGDSWQYPDCENMYLDYGFFDPSECPPGDAMSQDVYYYHMDHTSLTQKTVTPYDPGSELVGKEITKFEIFADDGTLEDEYTPPSPVTFQ